MASMSMALTGLQLDLANGGAVPPLSAIHFPTNLTVRPSDGYPLPTTSRPPCLFAILATSRSRTTFATMDAAATTSNRESALWCECTVHPRPPRTIDETVLPNRPASTSHESMYAVPAPSLDITLAMYVASRALSLCRATLLSMVDGPILDACQQWAAPVICPYISSLRAGESAFESRTPISLSLPMPPRLTATPAMTRGPIIEPRPASSTPQTITGRPAGRRLLNRAAARMGEGGPAEPLRGAKSARAS